MSSFEGADDARYMLRGRVCVEDAPDIVNTLFDQRYLVTRTLCGSQFAWRFEATDTRLERLVVLNILKYDAPDGYQPETRRAFKLETMIIAYLRSSTTLTIFGDGECATAHGDNVLFMVTEHFTGVPLDEYLMNARRLERMTLVLVLRSVLLSLDELHQLGEIHQCLKPSCIMIRGRETSTFGNGSAVKVSGHGTINRYRRDISQGEDLSYVAPEQVSDEGLPQGPWTDVYALGMIAYEALNGHTSPPLVDTHGQLGSIIDRMVLRDGHLRYQTAGEVLEALDALG